MSGIQMKIIRHTKKQEHTTLNKENNHLMKTDPGMTQMLN